MKSYEYNGREWVLKKSIFKKLLIKLKPYWWDEFWYTYHSNGIIGPGGRYTKKFKEGRLALVLAILGLVLIIIFGTIIILK